MTGQQRQKQTAPRMPYYWVWGINPENGKYAIVGPYTTEEKARSDCQSMDQVRVWKLHTRDNSRAAQIIKGKVLKNEGISNAMQRYGRKRVEPGSQSDSGQTRRDPFAAGDDDDDI